MSSTQPFRTYLVAGLVASALAAVLAHAYRGAYLALGGTPFVEINALSTTLAAVIPVLGAAVAYRFAEAWLPKARAIFTRGVLAFGVLSALPFVFAPLHPGFAWLSTPLHVIVSATGALVIPAWVARASRVPTAASPSEVAS